MRTNNENETADFTPLFKRGGLDQAFRFCDEKYAAKPHFDLICEKNEILPSKVKMRFSRVFFITEPNSLIEAISEDTA